MKDMAGARPAEVLLCKRLRRPRQVLTRLYVLQLQYDSRHYRHGPWHSLLVVCCDQINRERNISLYHHDTRVVISVHAV